MTWYIAICDMYIAHCDMTLGEKIRHLRAVEGTLRGLGRPLTQGEVIGQMKRELRRTISQSYLSQIESGARPHMTHGTRDLLARFFKVHPGFLVDDAEGYHPELRSDLRIKDASIDSWLYAAAETFHDDSRFAEALRLIAEFPDTRKALLLLGEAVKVPGLIDHLYDTLKSGPRQLVRT
ncbi:MAG TPA: helix-turn-helix domain-containing protein [Verrucomicrobiae bacterium]|nr:helix-turn-helix domain-containing protein [Verrucomicrobiae bacterium]